MTTLLDGLYAYWPLTEPSDGSVMVARGDVSAVGANNLFDTTNKTPSRAGLLGLAGDFTPAGSDTLYAEDSAALSTGDIDFTLRAIVKLDAKTGNDSGIICREESTTAREFRLVYDDSDDRFRFIIFATGGGVVGNVLANNLGSPSTGTYYHVVAWHDATANKVYIQVNNGTADEAATSGAPVDKAIYTRIGAYNAGAIGGYMDGSIEQVGFWKRTLTADERTALYASGAGLAYPFGETLPALHVTYAAALEYWNIPGAVHFDGTNDRTYFSWITQTGQVRICYYDHDSATLSASVLVDNLYTVDATQSRDDHNAPALLILADGTICCFYSIHEVNDIFRLKKSTNQEDISAWGSAIDLQDSAAATVYNYPQPYLLSDGTIALFYRRNVNATGLYCLKTSADDGDTWGDGTVLVDFSGTSGGAYFMSAMRDDELHVAGMQWLNTGEYRFDMFYMYSPDAGTTWQKRDATEITLPASEAELDLVYNSGTDACRVHSIETDSSGNPFIVFATKNDPNNEYRFAHYHASAWSTHQITTSSIFYGTTTNFYTGGAAIDPDNPYRVYLSKKATTYWEIEEWTSGDSGATWALDSAVTSSSVIHNWRPQVVKDHHAEMPLVWMDGFYIGDTVGGEWTGYYRSNIVTKLFPSSPVTAVYTELTRASLFSGAFRAPF